jgi:hypothetical protein
MHLSQAETHTVVAQVRLAANGASVGTRPQSLDALDTVVEARKDADPADRPRFGEVAQWLAGVALSQLDTCLETQRRDGGKLGDVLRAAQLLNRDQIKEVLAYQAEWVAQATEHRLGRKIFPYPTFLSLCMPAFNEAENIEDTLDAACAMLPRFVKDFEVVVVNDGSRDRTAEVVAAYSSREPRVRLVSHEHNRGYGAAITTALRAGRGDHVAFIDSDGQFSLLDLSQFLAQLDAADIVVGYRYKRADPWHRKMNAHAWGWLIRVVLGVRVHDLDCAFKIFPRKVVDRLCLTAQGAGINAEIMAQCCRGRLAIRQVPVEHFPRYHGAPTGAAWRVIAKAFRELPRMLKYRLGKNVLLDPTDPVGATSK